MARTDSAPSGRYTSATEQPLPLKEPLTDEQKALYEKNARLATRTVCAAATDTEDAAVMLEALGLIPYRYDDAQAAR